MNNEDNNINVLNEVNKGCCMGMDAIDAILDKAEGKEFKECLKKYYKRYEKIGKKVGV